MTFEEFKARVDKVVERVSGGMSSEDFADACWYDLYEDLGEDVEDEDIIECLVEADDIFAQIVELQE